VALYNEEIVHSIKGYFKHDLVYYYIPFRDQKLIFIEDNTTNKILTAFASFKDDNLTKILDVGYIELE